MAPITIIKLSSLLLLTTTIIITTIITPTHAQFYSVLENGGFYSGNHANADIAIEKRNNRLSNDVIKDSTRTIIDGLHQDHKDAEYQIYYDRKSPYLKDGVTPIELETEPEDDPRVPIGFGDPLVQRDFDVFLTSSTSPAVLDAIDQTDETDETKLVPMESIHNGWILVQGKGDLYDRNSDLDAFSTMLNQNTIKLIRIVCESCVQTHKEVFYRRFTTVPSDLLTIIKSDWKTTTNTFNVDFKLYSTYNDAITDQNSWTYCGGFGETDHGFPGTCGPTEAVDDQWINMDKGALGQTDVGIYVQDPTAPTYASERADWEIANELLLQTNPIEAKAKGLCWHLPHRDARRECWWACKYAEQTDNLGAMKLCLNLRHKGQVWKTRKFSEESETTDGLVREQKIKATHALGLDDGLPNLGVF